MSDSGIAVRVNNLSVQFGDFYAVKNISFDVQRGEIFGFLGANGAGKTTTIRVLCGLLPPTQGEIEIEGESYKKLGSNLKMKVGYMSQKFTLYDDMTVYENLDLTANLHRMSNKQFEIRKKELLQFIGWNRPLNIMVKDLSGGQKQQVSLVAALIHNPDIVFLDEPTAGVSPASRARFWELIRQIAKSGKTVFVTTHYMDEAEQCGRIALMRDGELVALNSPQILKEQTFPQGLIELEPKRKLTSLEIEKLKNLKEFTLFEPYGLRFHAETKVDIHLNNELKWIEELMDIHNISPSLEDVFIRIVEGLKR